MANVLVTPTWVLKDVGLGFENNVKFITNIRQYDNRYEFGGAKIGNTVQYRLPQQWLVSDGQALQEQPILDQTVPISLTNQKHIDFAWSSAQATTEIQEVRARYTMPAGRTMASAADAFTFNAVYRDVYQAVGTPGTTPSATLTYFQAGVKLTDVSTPDSGRFAMLDPMAMATIANTSSTLFNPSSAISANYRNGQFGANQLGISEWYQDQNRPAHTTGTFTASTPIVNGAGQTGSSLITSGWASGAAFLKRGDKFTVAGVFSVNPLSKQSTGRLQDFVFSSDFNDTTGAMTIPLAPSIITTGALQNVSNAPANGAAITVWSANPAGGTLATTVSPQSVVAHPEAFAFVTADLEMPNGGAESSRVSSPQGGFSLRMAKQWDIRTDQNITRIDMLIGAAVTQARLAVRVVG